jgi:hypothetical protein
MSSGLRSSNFESWYLGRYPEPSRSPTDSANGTEYHAHLIVPEGLGNGLKRRAEANCQRIRQKDRDASSSPQLGAGSQA